MLRTGSKKIIVNAFGGPGPEFSDNPVEQSENARRASREILKSTRGLEHQDTKKYADKLSTQARAASGKTWVGDFGSDLDRLAEAKNANNQSSHWAATNFHASDTPTNPNFDHSLASHFHQMAWEAHGRVNAPNAKTVDQHKLAEDFHKQMGNDFTGDGTPEEAEKHYIAAAHHATAAHVLERHGYNSSDDAAADREF